MNQRKQNSVRIGVIGCGAIADLFHLPALSKDKRTREAIALSDSSPARLEAMNKKFHASFTCSTYQELVGRVDGVIIATPPQSHFPIAKFFLEQGIPVLCEKPLSESSEEAHELVALSRKTGAALAVNQTRRFFPTYQKIRQLVADGVLGKLESITYHDGYDFEWPAASAHHFRPEAKGAWSDTGVHLLDSVCYWLGKTPTLVGSFNDSLGGPEAMATVRLECDGCQIEVKVSRLGRLSNGFRIVGTLGSISAEAEDWDELTVEFRDGTSKRFKLASSKLKYNDFAVPMLDNFIRVISEGLAPQVPGESVLGTIDLLAQAYQSAEPYPKPWNDHLSKWRDRRPFQHLAESRKPKVLVTGVSGFVGGRVVEAMALTELFEPVAAIRGWPRAARVAVHPISLVPCDILKPDQVEEAMRGVDAVVHCAYTDDREAIVDGTRNLLEGAKKHRISNFVYLSSAEVYGNERLGIVDESERLLPTGRPYGDAKLEAETLCQSYAAHGVFTTILRPSLIYGPHGSSWSVGIAKKLQSGQWGLFEGFGEGFANLVYIDDLVQAIFLSLASPASSPRVLNVNGGQPPTWNEYFQTFNTALGLPPLRPIAPSKSKWKTVSTDVVRAATSRVKAMFFDQLMDIYMRGGLASRLMKKLKGRLDSTPSSGELTDLYARKAIYNDDKIRRELHYSHDFELQAGIQSTIDWMQLHELIQTSRPNAAEVELAANQSEAFVS